MCTSSLFVRARPSAVKLPPRALLSRWARPLRDQSEIRVWQVKSDFVLFVRYGLLRGGCARAPGRAAPRYSLQCAPTFARACRCSRVC